MTRCPDIAAWERLEIGAVDAEEAASLARHLSRCPECRAAHERVGRNQRLLGPLRCALGGDGPPMVEILQEALRGGEPAAVRAGGGGQDPDRDEQVAGRTIGPYQLLRVLGSGGMGIVYEAQQRNPARTVALKVLRSGLRADRHRLTLFEREVQSLARLRHPSIATIYDAGCTDDGQHYFAMELVDGEPITDYARRRDLPTRERLELFGRICDAVSYAHQRGVIHRDLKPSNILVHGDAPSDIEMKVLDFGLARITDADVTLTTISADVYRIEGTLAYMSPEQARGDPNQIDVRSDVYALGVMLYELMTDQLPYDVHRSLLAESLRIICEQPPCKPSTIARTLPGDLQTIILKALEKEPKRRYQSAAELAGDIERYLRGHAIMAKGDSGWYVLRKALYRRRRALVITAATLLIAATAGGYALIQSNIHAAANRRRVVALTPYLRAEHLIERRQGVAAEHWHELANDAINLLDQAIEIDPDFSAAYYQRGRLRLQLHDWSDSVDAQSIFTDGLADFEQADLVAGAQGFPPALWAAGRAACEQYAHRGWTLSYGEDEGESDEGESDEIGRARSYYRRAARLDQSDSYVKLSQALLMSIQGVHGARESEKAIELLEELIADPLGRHLDEAHLMLAVLCAGLQNAYWGGMSEEPSGVSVHPNSPFDYERAERHLRRALALDATNDRALWAAAVIARRRGRLEEAEQYSRQALQIKPKSIAWNRTLGYTYAVAGKYRKARSVFERLVQWYPENSRCLYLLSRAHHWNRDYAAVEEAARRGIHLDPSNEFAWSNLVLALWKQGRFSEAEGEFQNAIEIAPENFGAWMNHAEGMYTAGRVREAADAYEQVCAIYAIDPTAWINRARVLKGLGKPREAFECLKRVAKCHYVDAVPLADLACEYLASDEPDLRDTQAGIEIAALAQEPTYSAPWAQAIVALADYRAGKWRESLSRTSRIDGDDSAGAWARLVAAAALRELQQPQEALTSFKSAERLLTSAPVDDVRLVTFYEEVAHLLGEVAQPLSTTRPALYEQPF